jgi:hypothetical protein
MRCIVSWMRKIYRFKLTSDERADLEAITKQKKVAAAKVIKVQSLLLADESPEGKAWKDRQIIEAINIKTASLERLRKRCCEMGPLEALKPKQRTSPPRRQTLDGEREAKLIAIACSAAPRIANDGHCVFLRIAWWNWRSLTLSVMKRFVGS